jgi:peptide/nickel transport system substrate-binding protein
LRFSGSGIGSEKISPQSRHFASPEGQLVFQEWAASDAGFDATQANTWLDDIGMVDSNSDGWRDLPSGIPFTLIIDVSDWGGYEIQMEAAEEIEDQWETNLKIQVEINSLSVSEAESRERQGYYMLCAAHVSELDLWTYPDWVFPVRNTRMFPLEGLWYETGGLEGMEPEPGSPAAQLQSLYDQGLAEPDVDARHEIVWDAIQIHMDEGPFVIGVSGDQPMPVVIKDYFHNVPEYGVLGPWAPGSPGNMHSEQFWIEPRVYLPMIVR